MNLVKSNALGIEIGAVSIKYVTFSEDKEVTAYSLKHDGNPREKLLKLFHENKNQKVVITGQTAKNLFNISYRSEIECIEKALAFYNLDPDILLSLGGETFTVYMLKNGIIKNIISTSKCAAGTGEFISQQFKRMNFTLQEGIDAAKRGKKVDLATRCSVHCKSDATHKLNKGECTREDITYSLIEDLAHKICRMVEHTKWTTDTIVIIGGVSKNLPFIEKLNEKLISSNMVVPHTSHCFEAFGAFLFAKELPDHEQISHLSKYARPSNSPYKTLKPLSESINLLDYRVKSDHSKKIRANDSYILGVDAGSTTTKAVLFNLSDGTIGASCYLRTHGNPVNATKNCINELMGQIKDTPVNIIQAATTGSGREMVSVYLDNCPSFNEILAHARSASEEVHDVDTVFEIGGQDSKYISFLKGVPIDYAMNDGCSAGTGSFLEESLLIDMNIPVEKSGEIGILSKNPISFGERCAAFINTDLRNALQQGAVQDDVVAGLIYSIVDNYISRVVGIRSIGQKILFQGGVALNKSVALAMAARSKKNIVVPTYSELMGALGCALMIRDRLNRGEIKEKKYCLEEFSKGGMEFKQTFICKTCENSCEIKNFSVKEKTYPFGGLCSKYENLRHKNKEISEGKNLVDLRNKLMFETFGPKELPNPLGKIGIPMALTTYEFFPYYAKLINELGYNVVCSSVSKEGNKKTQGSICYPCEIAHGAVFDLIDKKVDYIFLPHVVEGNIPDQYLHSYFCINTTTIPDLIKGAFDKKTDKLLSPHLGFSQHLLKTSKKEVGKIAVNLGLKKRSGYLAHEKALMNYMAFKKEYEDLGNKMLEQIEGQPTILLAARPYVAYSSEANLSLPRKIISRGYNIVPIDLLPNLNVNIYKRNVWYFGQQILNAVTHVKKIPNFYILMVSCFSCFPDASIFHLARHELSGSTFCYLEIDSHTAHAGFDTRISAFLDIIEERK